MEEHLRELELDSNASWEDVKKSYRELLRVWHPDRFAQKDYLKEKAEAKTRALNHAFENLSKNWDSWESSKQGGKHYRNRSNSAQTKSNIDPQRALEAARRTAALYVELRHTKRMRRWSKFVFWSAIFGMIALLAFHFIELRYGEDAVNTDSIINFFTGTEKKKNDYQPMNWRKIDSINKE
jgi:hypothetical protein